MSKGEPVLSLPAWRLVDEIHPKYHDWLIELSRKVSSDQIAEADQAIQSAWFYGLITRKKEEGRAGATFST